MKSIIKATPLTLATRLRTIQAAKAIMEAEEKEVRDGLLASLKNQGVKSVKLEDGSVFTRSTRSTLKVKDPTKAWIWAEEHTSLKIDTAKAMKILRRELKLPKFFEKVDTEYLTVRKVGEADE